MSTVIERDQGNGKGSEGNDSLEGRCGRWKQYPLIR